jgi:hypothetical protein
VYALKDSNVSHIGGVTDPPTTCWRKRSCHLPLIVANRSNQNHVSKQIMESYKNTGMWEMKELWHDTLVFTLLEMLMGDGLSLAFLGLVVHLSWRFHYIYIYLCVSFVEVGNDDCEK